MKKLLAALCVLSLLCALLPSFEQRALADQSGMIRVRLTVLGTHTTISLVTTGDYVSSGAAIASGTTVTASLSGSTVTLKANGRTLASGPSVTMKRTQGGTACGVRFTSPAVNNLYLGDMTFVASGGSLLPVLTTYVETYLYGVVPYELSNSSHIEGLKAQAVAARTYAMRAQKTGGNYDLTDSTSAQVFRGYKASYTNAISAVDATRGQCLFYGSAYAACYYTDSNGGQIESSKNAWGSDLAYLRVKDDPYDLASPSATVKKGTIAKDGASLSSGVASLIRSAAASQLQSAGMGGASIVSVNRATPSAPRFPAPSRTFTQLTLNVTFRSGSATRSFDVDVATYGGLESTLGLSINSGKNEIVSVSETSSAFILEFRRWGHGVGLSQCGAQQMAKVNGFGYRDILSFYYPGTNLTTLALSEIVNGDVIPPVGPTAAPDTAVQARVSLGDPSSRLNVRASASTGSRVVATLSHGQTVAVSGQSGEWSAVSGSGFSGYVMSKYLTYDGGNVTPQPTATPAPTSQPTEITATVVLGNSSSRLNLRGAASTSGSVLTKVPHGAQVTVLSQLGSWYQVRYGAYTGYVSGQYLRLNETQPTQTPAPVPTVQPTQPPETGTTATVRLSDSSSRLNVRATASTSARVVGRIGHGAKVTVLGTTGSWANIETGSVKGYVSAHYLVFDQVTPVPAPTQTPAPTADPITGTYEVSVATSLNMRAAPSSGAAILMRLKNGARVSVSSISGGWAQITVDGRTGYVSAAYLKPVSGGGDASGYQTLRYGDTGESVKALQRRLKQMGYFTGEIGGNYLTLTETAVKAWQRANGLAQDGVATPEIQARIFAQ
ncbi:MAG: SpoIID/LytB domain-containing protein [Clostridia bacterium]|nr:SpoIID/LytB domain-containing protein [Clostridia bacterium]